MKQLVYTVALLMIAFSLNAHAFVNNFPDEILIKNTQTQLSFSVTNTENIARKLSIEISAPTEFEYLEKPATILAGQTKQVKIVFYPKDNLNESVFNAKATIKLGINNAQKNFTISFLKENSCPAEIDTTVTKGRQNNEFTIFSEVKNQSNSDVSFNLQTISGLPTDWSFSTENTVLLAPLETRVIQTKINAQSSFEGNAELIFECENFVKKIQIYIKHENNSPTGLFSLGFLQWEDNGGVMLFNAFLVAIAAVLLLMFISRLVRILAEKNQIQPAFTMTNTQEKEPKQPKEEIRIYQKADPKLENIKKLVTQKKAKGKK